MFDIFPLQDTNLNREQADAALQKQFDIMHVRLWLLICTMKSSSTFRVYDI